MLRFSFMFLLVLNNNKIPKPLPVNKPDNKLPILISFDRYNSVIITLPAQLGIKPIKLAIKYVKKFLCNNTLPKFFSPILNISILRGSDYMTIKKTMLIMLLLIPFNKGTFISRT